MKTNKLAFLALAGMLMGSYGYAAVREIAITIDDLPFVGSSNNNSGNIKRAHDRFQNLLQALIDKQVPATGFIIAGSIGKAQWSLLDQFRAQGFILGNHTYSHGSLGRLSAEKYIADVAEADKILASLLTSPKYFRYPYLAEGKGEKRQKVYDYLAANDYTIAPVTIDSKDYKFNAELLAINWRNRQQHLSQIKKRYLAYIWNQTLRAEALGKNNPKHSGKQILLIHANLLNSHLLGDVLEMYQQNGYKFISLTDALKKEPLVSDREQIRVLPERVGGLFKSLINTNYTYLQNYLMKCWG